MKFDTGLPGRKIGALICVSMSIPLLQSCSYGFDILAQAQQGRLVFVSAPGRSVNGDCVSRVDVGTSGKKAMASSGDDAAQVAMGTYWKVDRRDDDICMGSLPFAYGVATTGIVTVAAKPLKRGLEYEVYITLGATGYGAGRFMIHSDGKIENLPLRQDAGSNELNRQN